MIMTNSVANVLPFNPTRFPKRPEGIESLFPEGIDLFPEGIESLFPEKTPTKPIESVVPRVAESAANVGNSTPADRQSKQQQRLNDQAKQGGTNQNDEIVEFMGRVVPWPVPGESGYINLHWLGQKPGYMPGLPYTDVQAFIDRARSEATHPRTMKDIYFCLTRQSKMKIGKNGKPWAVRRTKNATHVKAIWIDADVKPEYYANTFALVTAFKEFLANAALPAPSAIVASGSGGLHIYWISDRVLTIEEWRPYATGLKALVIKHGFKCDGGLTTDAARVLRVPDTFNRKHDPAKPVVLKALGRDYDFAKDLTHVATPVIATSALPAQVSRTNAAPTPFSEAEETRLRSALACIPANERDAWRDIGFALHSLNWGEKGFEIWSNWSGTCPEKFNEADQQSTWESFDRPYNGPRITTATIFYKAFQLGWVDDAQQIDYRTDLGNARRLVNRHGENIRYIPDWRKWMVWQEGRWEIDSNGAIMRLAKETVEAIYLEAMGLADTEKRDALLSHAIRSQAEARLKAMVSLAESEASVVAAARLLDADPWLLGVQNGVIELKMKQFRPARREDLITKRAGVIFDPDAKCPEWLKFLDTVTGGDSALQAYMQRVVGYTLTGSVREEVMFVFYGTGNNGKSTYRETLHALLGDYALAADAGLLTERKKPGGATEEIARLKGRRFVAVNETAENDHLSEARVKFITSQDTITARNLYGHLFDFFPMHKTALTTNHKPIVRGTDEGIWRRVQLIPFIVTIPKNAVEKDFRERRLMPELPGILNWALAGLADYLKQGLNPPKAVLASTQDYRNDMDVVGQWLDERCDMDQSTSVATGLAYVDYSLWAQEEVGWTLGKLTFRRNLADRGFSAKKGSGGQRMVQGLRLKGGGGGIHNPSGGRPPLQ